jgi:hypothetical protein
MGDFRNVSEMSATVPKGNRFLGRPRHIKRILKWTSKKYSGKE